jgi:hypothetical protein
MQLRASRRAHLFGPFESVSLEIANAHCDRSHTDLPTPARPHCTVLRQMPVSCARDSGAEIEKVDFGFGRWSLHFVVSSPRKAEPEFNSLVS